MPGAPAIGSTFGPYRIEAVIGRGGMGVVYRAEHVRLRRRVALKLLSADLAQDERFQARFLREAQLAAAIEHPGFVPVYDSGEIDGQLFLAMRLVDGRDLATVLREDGPLAPERAVTVLAELASALDAAHAHGLIHRDVKPANVLCGDEHVYLVDFGIGADARFTERLTDTGQAVGTVDYMAPERLRGEPPDARADVYSLGCLFFECLTGEVPFPRAGAAESIYAHLEEDPPSVSQRRPGIPAALDDVVGRALAKDPDERWRTCGDLAAAAAGVPVAVRPRVGRRPLVAAVVAAVLTVGAVVVLLTRGSGAPAVHVNSVAVIDPAGNEVVADIRVGDGPGPIASGAGSVWVVSTDSATLTRIDTRTRRIRETGGLSTNTFVGSIAVAPHDVWITQDCQTGSPGSLLRINTALPGASIHDAEAITLAGEPPAGVTPQQRSTGCGLAADDSGAWAATTVPSGLGRVRVEPGTRTMTPGRIVPRRYTPDAIAVGAGALWVHDVDGDVVRRTDPRTLAVERSIQTGVDPVAIAVGSGAVWVANQGDDSVSRIDPATDRVTKAISVGDGPAAIAAGYGSVWVADADAGTVSRIDARTDRVTATIHVGHRPAGIAVTRGDIWVAVRG